MAYTSCAADIAANIAPDCANPLVSGYTGRAVLFPVGGGATFVADATNPRIITSITLPGSDKWIVLDNAQIITPLDGSTSQSNGDSGRFLFNKQLSFRVPLRGADTSKDIIEPLTQSATGWFAVVEKRDKVGDGSFEIIGMLQGLRPTADGIVRNESENGGDVAVTMTCQEAWFECDLFDTDYATTLAAFETFLANGL